MPDPKDLDPTTSPIAFFGYELRRYRQEAGLSQGRPARRTGFAVKREEPDVSRGG
ncbi:hypothetical protein [Streptosporangium roseum]|uniref:hypothetical protein n=1 Tax=Streptosporangium roseum TaxID=2001 RepID=UPI003328A29F